MNHDPRWQWAASAAAEIINLHHNSDLPKAELFQRLQHTIFGAICLAMLEEKETMLTPSKN